jgi:hypothetical protein
MSSAPDFNEVILARKIRRVLDEGAAHVSDDTASRLAAARRMALSRKKAEPVRERAFSPVLVGAGGAPSMGFGPAHHRPAPRTARGRRWQLLLPLAVLAVTLFGVAHWEEQRRIAELANLDVEVLSDALPPDAYLDHGFNEYLARSR